MTVEKEKKTKRKKSENKNKKADAKANAKDQWSSFSYFPEIIHVVVKDDTVYIHNQDNKCMVRITDL